MQDRLPQEEPARQRNLAEVLLLARDGGPRQHLAETFFPKASDDASRHDLLTV